MRKLFRRKYREQEQKSFKPIEVDYAKIDNFILRKYGLKDIKKKELFMLLNILFMISGVVAILTLLYGGLKIVTGISWAITIALGYIIFRMVKESGIPAEGKDEEKIENKKEKED